MKINKMIALCLVSLLCIACSNSENRQTQKSNQSKNEKQIVSKLGRIEKAFEKGDESTACDLQLKLSKDLLNYEELSPELLKSVKKIEIKCGNRFFSIDF